MLQDEANRKRLDAGFLGKLGEAYAGAMIGFVGQARLEVAERIVGERGEMDDAVDASEVRNFGVAGILENGRHVTDDAALRERATLVEIAVETDHVVSGLLQHRRHHRPDVTEMSSQQYAHVHTPCFVWRRQSKDIYTMSDR